MIKLTGFDGREMVINAELIEKIEEVPECIITLVNGRKYVVKDSCQDVVDKVVEFKRKIHNIDLRGTVSEEL